jgi:hypothetical protein
MLIYVYMYVNLCIDPQSYCILAYQQFKHVSYMSILFFIDSELLGLDPHSVFSACNEEPFPSAELISQVHVSELDALDASRLDPSLALAFYFRDRGEFQVFCDEVRINVEKKNAAGVNPLFCVQHSAPAYGSHGTLSVYLCIYIQI